VLGIDASTKTIAYAVIKEGELLSYGETNLGTGDMYSRLGNAKDIMDGLVEIVGKDVGRCFIESAVRVNNIKVTVNLAYMYGIIMGAVVSHGIVMNEVSPVVWQKYIGNKPFTKIEKSQFADQYPDKSAPWIANQIRLRRKQITIDWVKDKFNIQLESDNIADAVGIAYFGSRH
jgi:Holliday junction resolvasome RuvABC endonuclease subunit